MNASSGHTTKKTDILQLVSFRLDNEEYGVDILIVQEIIRMVPITKVPKSPPFVEGVINLRGRVIPVINLRKRFGLDIKEPDAQTRIMVIAIDTSVIGLIVDAVSEVLRLSADTVEPTPAGAGVDAEYITGVGKLDNKLIILLNLKKLFSDKEKELMGNIG